MQKQSETYFLIAIFLLGLAHADAQELAPSKTTYKPGEEITLSFSGGPGNAKDWVGIYKEGQTPGEDSSTQYKYADGKTSGELVFDPLPLGKYEAHLFENDGFVILASTSFEVSEEADVPMVSLSKAEYEEGEVIEVTFSGGPGNAKDWVGIYKEGQTPGEDSSTQYKYADGKTSGELVFDPLPLGKYEAHLFEDDGFVILASTSFEVSEEADVPMVSLSKAEYEEGEVIEVTFSGGPGNAKDWVGIYKEGQTPGDVDSTQYKYVDGKTSGELVFDPLPLGKYEAHLFENDGFVILATASFNVKEGTVVNTAPVVSSQSVEVNEDGTVSITLTGSDEDGDALSFTVLSQPENGTLSGTAPALTYSPKANYSGSDSFTYKANDGNADSNIATVTISVASVNDKPMVTGQSVEVNEDGTVSITLTGSDEDGDALSFTVLSQPENGTLSGTAPDLSYSPKANYSGSDSFTFKANDGNADSNIATVTISVASVNDKPTVAGQSVEVNEDGTVSITLTGSDEDGDTLSFTVLSQPKNGTLSGTAPDLSFSPKANYSGSDSFTFNASDGDADSGTATVTINVASVNDKPMVAGQSVEVNEDGTVSITLTGSDEDGDTLSFTVLSQPKNGTLSGTAPALTYSPKADYSGSDSFTFKASDEDVDSDMATVTINVIKKIGGEANLSLSKTQYREGEPVEISLSAGPGNAKDWIGVFREEQKPGDDGVESVSWKYTDGRTSGSMVLDGTHPGNYKVYWLENDGYKIIASAVFTTLSKGVYFSENFDSLKLGVFESDSEKDGDGTDWTAQGPTGWVMNKGDGHGPIAGGEAVKEFDGWTFVDPVSWNATAGQLRGEFKKGRGVIAVADSDEYDDMDPAPLDASLETPVIDISGAGESTLILKYDSSWRKEPQNGSVTVSYDGGDEIELLKLDGNSPDALNDTVKLELNNPAGAKSVVVRWDYQGNNNWWWAIDNISIYEKLTSAPNSWTVFVYGNADHNLTSNFLGDLEEMKEVGGNEKLNIVVETDLDASRKYILDVYNVKQEHRDKVTRGVVLESGHEVVQVLSERDTDDANELGDFLDWGISNYPADRYGLVLWDHGGQWTGFGGDKNNGQRTWGKPNMKTADIKEAVLQTLLKHDLKKLDFLSFDTCLMGGAEVLADVHELCDVYIACPELDYADGWDYSATLGYLKAFPDTSNIEFGKKEVMFWGEHHNRKQSDREYKFHVAYDMKLFNVYNDKLKAFTAAILKESISGNNALILAKLRREAIHYWNSGTRIREGSVGVTDYIDLGSFAEEIAKHFTGELKTASLGLVDAIKKMIIAKTAGSKRQEAVGLSIYYPIDGGLRLSYTPDRTLYYNYGTVHEVKFWAHLNFLTPEFGGDNWLKYLGQVKNINNNDKSAPEISSRSDGSKSGRLEDGNISIEEDDFHVASWNDPAIMDFEVTNGDDAYSAYVSLVSNELTGNPNEYVYLGGIGSALLDGEGEYEVEWDATMPVISLADSDTYAPIYLGGWAMEPGSNLYISLADYQAPGSAELTPLILITRFDEDGYGVIDNIMEDAVETGSTEESTHSATSSDIELEPGGKLWPVYYMEELTEDGGYETWFISGEDAFITIPENGKDGLEISFQTVEEGDYAVEVQTFDYFDNGSEVLTYFVYVPEEGVDVPMPELSIGLKDDQVVISWPSDFDGYRLEWTNDLGGENLNEVPAGKIITSAEKFTYVLSPTDLARFYRLIKR